MSSTNRNAVRNDSDYYVTPIDDIKLFLNNLSMTGDENLLQKFNGVILDPCAGGNEEIKDENGVIEVAHPMSYPTAIQEVFNKSVFTLDIRENSLSSKKGDYLQTELKKQPDIIITNPPFKLALEIIKKALNDVADDGYVIMLLRLNFFGSKERKPFFDAIMPEYCFVHHERISFMDKKDDKGYVVFDKNGSIKKGTTDSIEYCHMIFHKGYSGYTKLFVI